MCIRDRHRLVEALVPVRVVERLSEDAQAVPVVAGGVEAALRTAAAPADRSKLERQLAQAEAQIAKIERDLANPRYVEGAPPHVVEQARRRLAEAITERDTVRRNLDSSG